MCVNIEIYDPYIFSSTDMGECIERAKMGAMVGASVGLSIGFLFGTATAFRLVLCVPVRKSLVWQGL